MFPNDVPVLLLNQTNEDYATGQRNHAQERPLKLTDERQSLKLKEN